MQRIQNFINGVYVDPLENQWLECFEPATGEVYAKLADSTASDLEVAIAAAKVAQGSWQAMSYMDRGAILERIGALIEEQASELAEAESKDNGKPLALAKRVDIPRAALNFKFFARSIAGYRSECYDTSAQILNYTLREPLGLVGCISPWNLPLYLFTWKIAPALAAGCTVIGKPSEITPLTASMLGAICHKAGLPAGVLQILHGRGAGIGQLLCQAPEIEAISFTGGTETGKRIATLMAPSFRKVSLELGGKNPSIVFADADLDLALTEVTRAAFSNQGQICLCGSRILVERSLYEEFKQSLLARVQKLRVGDPLIATSDQGALVSRQHLEKVAGYVELARQEGASILCGGTALQGSGRCAGGYFYAPTLIEGASLESAVNQQEIFGPVATIMPFDSEEQAQLLANNTKYGLAANVWTRDLGRAQRMSRNLAFGIVWINCWMNRDLRTPFGGVKASGLGREGGFAALDFFTEVKNVCLAY